LQSRNKYQNFIKEKRKQGDKIFISFPIDAKSKYINFFEGYEVFLGKKNK